MKTKLFLLSLSLLALHLGARAQDTSIVYGSKFYIAGKAAQGGTEIVYQWQRNGDSIAGATEVDYTTDSTLVPGMYTYVRKSRCVECSGRWQFSNPHTIRVVCPDSSSLQPSAFTASKTTVCIGTDNVYTVPNVAGITYQWKFPNGWAAKTASISNTITLVPGTSSVPGNVSVTAIRTASGCASTALSVAVTKVDTQPTLTLTSTNNLNQKMTLGNSITNITYTRGGTINGNVTLSTNPGGFAITVVGGTAITVNGTPTGSGSRVYTITAPAAASCPTAATATGVVTIESCTGEIYDKKCYVAKAYVDYTANNGTADNCPTWFGAEYTKASYTVASNLHCPLNGVVTIYTGVTTSFSSSTQAYYGSANCSTSSASTSTTRISGQGLGKSAAVWPISNVQDNITLFPGVGLLCVRNY